ncbi:Aminoacylase-1-like Protein [Tribolium castaneum]|uniref:N-acyl-aliphatic-L-amino acid amidohydrolase n=2 Tax=Tribolium castaneum TaxID=7070 RepID=D6X327_TRICA|nr:PREDICTED: aminoacylase-1 [Tribolium castaneum]EFA10313.1 Aminoacylase-1-like Protein [Tribolium castaneum]|eukprot:XP_969065.1 PREDICTED: aminoacylase-1 [Tribolium castaneum]
MAPVTQVQKKVLDQQAVENFREYLRIPSVHPNIDYEPCVKFLEKQARGLGLPIKVYHVVPKKPIVVISWVGTEPSWPAIMLNSHMDVVPVFEDKWTHKPFGAEIDQQNRIYGRGAQDMKSIGIQYLEAVRRLKQQGVALKRTLHISFVPDEETGGIDGLQKFVHTKDFQKLNIGVTLDESVASPNEECVVFYVERCIWQFKIHCTGNPGHGSLLLENTAGEKVSYILNKMFEFRNGEVQKLKNNPNMMPGQVTALNLTQMTGGVQTNVVPPEFILTFDCRITPEADFDQFEATLRQWCKEAGPGVTIEFELKQSKIPPTKLDDSNPYWIAFKKATDKLGLKLKVEICQGATDARYVRSVGLPGIGFCPMNNTTVLLHNHDEYLSVETFLKGIEIYSEIVTSLANIEHETK